eukprot:TRINITY_DN1545_c0_g3_i1.p2 TRINITY_DN1545_c0_g3~~TRINITY_DN1545_c0_g3_i1.p2  ORF type:complete len:356 (+),score=71.56 TRINITY_DN1545_c0_g3_i1:79-1146(+)
MDPEAREYAPLATRKPGRPATRRETVLSHSLAKQRSLGCLPAPRCATLRTRAHHLEMHAFQAGDDELDGWSSDEEAEGFEWRPTLARPETKARLEARTICGLDRRPLFPAVLVLSLLWSILMAEVQGRVVYRLFGEGAWWSTFFFLLYAVTLAVFGIVSLKNPGVMPKAMQRKIKAGELAMPKRAKKHWLYERPVLRFHQYCRWTTNAIGLRNHREYMVMLYCFACVGIMNTVVDLVHLFMRLDDFRESDLGLDLIVVLHLIYSAYFSWYVIPLVRMHTGFISRNELTSDWLSDKYRVVIDAEGRKWNPDEYEGDYEEEDLIYDSTRNPFDHGTSQNLWSFFVTSRACSSQLGDF